MLLNELVSTTAAVGATRSRLAKVDALAALLRRLKPDETAAAIGLLIGSPVQGRLGVGWRSVTGLNREPATTPTLTVAEVDELLDRLAASEGAGSSAGRAQVLAELMGRATASEQDFLVRALLGEMRTGALEGVLVDAIARAADAPGEVVRRAVMLSGSLGETALLALSGGEEALAGVTLAVGRPLRPMLAASASTVAEALEATGEASVEYKLDGARIQVHRKGDEVRVFTRSLAEVTHRLPEVVESVLRLPITDAIFDGETLTLDEEGAPRPFQQTMSRFGADASREALLSPWFFDVLHLNGRDLIDEPLSARRAALREVAPHLVIPGVTTSDPEVAEAFSEEALGKGHEGVVVKAVDSAYTAGRRGSGWVKVKPVHTYDLVVLACEWGSGRRHGWLSNLHLGAYDPLGEYGEPGGFVMVGKTFKGLTDQLLRWQTERFQQIEVRRTAGTVWVAPVTVVEIAIDGVQASSRYPGGIALRFARVKRYRDDKVPQEADTIQTLRSLLRS
ncbi:ATP-dependent DNA ligase [Rathayibacter sp. KR2-224]|uniref:ATP-dependent DNA ligase n=1 Tax=Rathayibacter sp. KR2-224 TaxID=3400913 RepID=UPI003C02136D